VTGAKLPPLPAAIWSNPTPPPLQRQCRYFGTPGLGGGGFRAKELSAAIADLKAAHAIPPQIADYASYYLALARVETNDFNAVNKDLLPVHATKIRSPLSAKAWLLEARAIQTLDPATAVRLLREHYSELPQPRVT